METSLRRSTRSSTKATPQPDLSEPSPKKSSSKKLKASTNKASSAKKLKALNTSSDDDVLFGSFLNDNSVHNTPTDIKRMTVDATDLVHLLDDSVLSNQSSVSNSTNKRRQTVDCSDLLALLDSDNDVSVGSKSVTNDNSFSTNSMNNSVASQEKSVNMSLTNSSMNEDPAASSSRRQTVDAADFQGLLDDVSSTNKSSVHDSFGSASLSNIEDHATGNDRRQTVDMNDFHNMLSEDSMTENSSIQADTSDLDDRRQTVDFADLQKMMAEEDSVMSEQQPMGRDSIVSNDADVRRQTMDAADLEQLLMNESCEAMTGRESIDTVGLVSSVDHLLGDLDESSSNNSSMTQDVLYHAPADDVDELQNSSIANSYCDGDTAATIDIMELSVEGDGNNVTADSTVSISPGSRRKRRSSSSKSPLRKAKTPETAPVVDAHFATDSASLRSPVRARARVEGPKSALKSAAKPPLSTKKSVVFGSPTVSEFHKGSPTTNLTPMSKTLAKAMFSMSGSKAPPMDVVPESEETSENSRILDEWDRLSATSGDSPEQSVEIETPNSNSSKNSKRRKSKLFNISRDDVNGADEGSFSAAADVSCTVELPNTLADLVAETSIGLESAIKFSYYRPSISINDVSSASCTENLETSLQAVMFAVGGDYLNNDSAVSSDNSALHYSTSSTSVSTHSLGTLIGPDVHANKQLDTTPISKAGDDSLLSINSDISYRASMVSNLAASDRPSILSTNRDSLLNCSHTVELEGGLGDLVAELDNRLANEEANSNHSNVNISSVSLKSAGDDQTYGLEGNLGDILKGSEDLVVDTAQNDSMDEVTTESEDEFSQEESQLEIKAKSVLRNIANRSSIYEDLNTSAVLRPPMDRMSLLPPTVNTVLEPIALPTAAATVATNGRDVLQRLRALNAEARRNSLAQCSTPLASVSEQSVGTKRHSMNQLMSAKKQPMASRLSRLSVAPSDFARRQTIGIAGNGEPRTAPVDFNSVSASLKSVMDNCIFAKEYARSVLSDLSALAATGETLIASTVVASMRDSLENILDAAFKECHSTVNSIRTQRQKEWLANEQRIVQYFSQFSDSSPVSKRQAEQAVQVATQIWNKWESQLNAIAVDNATTLLRTAAAECTDSQPSTVTDGSSSASTINSLYKKINEAKLRLSQKSVQLDNIAAQQSDLLRTRAEQAAALASSAVPLPNEHNKTEVTTALAELAQQCKQAKSKLNETIQVAELFNRLTYSKVVCYSKSMIAINIAISSKAAITLKFNLSNQAQDLSTGVVIDTMHVDLVNNTNNKTDPEWLLSEALFIHSLACDETVGPLSSVSLDGIVNLGQLPNLLHKV
jgi:hypothetical protein